MRVLLLATILLTSGFALLPEASAACEPNPVQGNFCPGTYTGQIKERLEDFPPPTEIPACDDGEIFPFC